MEKYQKYFTRFFRQTKTLTKSLAGYDGASDPIHQSILSTEYLAINVMIFWDLQFRAFKFRATSS